MKRTRYLISTLVAAGILPVSQSNAQSTDGASSPSTGPDPDDEAVVRRFAQDHRFLLAQHRSHSSHASHSSHRSGSSGTVRAPVYTPPAPRAPRVTPAPSPRSTPTPTTRNDRSTPPSSILPSSPATAPQPFYSPGSSGSQDTTRSRVEEVVRKVQIGLMAYGYYDGKLDGMVGPQTRAALTRFQGDFNLNVTGTITPEVLDAFKIVAQ